MIKISKNLQIRIAFYILCFLSFLFLFYPSEPLAFAQGDTIRWSSPVNVSNTEEYISTDPFILADKAGFVHLFWAEKVLGDPIGQADTLMYAQWDGNQWSEPVDIFFAPLEEINLLIKYPTAVIDNDGSIHLIWMGTPNAPNHALFYSTVPASSAGSPKDWQPRESLADDLTGTAYSISIAYSPPRTLHVIYARVAAGDNPSEERAVTYIRSIDGGKTWSEPFDIAVIPYLDRGASNTSLLVEPPDKVYVSWTEWDTTGNGQAINFARSLDNGQTWEKPIKLTEKLEAEYERDWSKLGLLGPNHLFVTWEGGYRAYRYGMYSNDGGATWSEPIDTFPWLIGENGTVEYAEDSKGRIHLFIAQRIREGNAARGLHEGLWHSLWEGGNVWSEPTLAGGDNPMDNPKVTIVGGNKVLATWYVEPEFEIIAMSGQIMDAPELLPRPWPSLTPTTPATSTPVAKVAMSTPIPQFNNIVDKTQLFDSPSPGAVVLFSLLPVILFVGGAALLIRIKSGNRK